MESGGSFGGMLSITVIFQYPGGTSASEAKLSTVALMFQIGARSRVTCFEGQR